MNQGGFRTLRLRADHSGRRYQCALFHDKYHSECSSHVTAFLDALAAKAGKDLPGQPWITEAKELLRNVFFPPAPPNTRSGACTTTACTADSSARQSWAACDACVKQEGTKRRKRERTSKARLAAFRDKLWSDIAAKRTTCGVAKLVFGVVVQGSWHLHISPDEPWPYEPVPPPALFECYFLAEQLGYPYSMVAYLDTSSCVQLGTCSRSANQSEAVRQGRRYARVVYCADIWNLREEISILHLRGDNNPVVFPSKAGQRTTCKALLAAWYSRFTVVRHEDQHFILTVAHLSVGHRLLAMEHVSDSHGCVHAAGGRGHAYHLEVRDVVESCRRPTLDECKGVAAHGLDGLVNEATTTPADTTDNPPPLLESLQPSWTSESVLSGGALGRFPNLRFLSIPAYVLRTTDSSCLSNLAMLKKLHVQGDTVANLAGGLITIGSSVEHVHVEWLKAGEIRIRRVGAGFPNVEATPLVLHLVSATTASHSRTGGASPDYSRLRSSRNKIPLSPQRQFSFSFSPAAVQSSPRRQTSPARFQHPVYKTTLQVVFDGPFQTESANPPGADCTA